MRYELTLTYEAADGDAAAKVVDTVLDTVNEEYPEAEAAVSYKVAGQ